MTIKTLLFLLVSCVSCGFTFGQNGEGAKPIQAAVWLVDGSLVTGFIVDSELGVASSLGPVNAPVEHLYRLDISRSHATLYFKNGDQVKGKLKQKSIVMQLEVLGEQTVKLKSVSTILLSHLPVALPGLVGWYTFDGHTRDSGPKAVNGQATSLVAVADRFNYAESALHFSSLNQVVSVPMNTKSIHDGGNGMTVSCWVKYDKLQFANSGILLFSDSPEGNVAPTGKVIGLWVSKEGLLHSRVNLQDGKSMNLPKQAQLTQNTWHHVALVIDWPNKSIRQYIDGVMAGSMPMSANVRSTSYLTIGVQAQEHWIGSIDDVKIYDRTLTVNELSLLRSQ